MHRSDVENPDRHHIHESLYARKFWQEKRRDYSSINIIMPPLIAVHYCAASSTWVCLNWSKHKLSKRHYSPIILWGTKWEQTCWRWLSCSWNTSNSPSLSFTNACTLPLTNFCVSFCTESHNRSICSRRLLIFSSSSIVISPVLSCWETSSSRETAQEHANLQLSGKPSLALDDPPAQQ